MLNILIFVIFKLKMGGQWILYLKSDFSFKEFNMIIWRNGMKLLISRQR